MLIVSFESIGKSELITLSLRTEMSACVSTRKVHSESVAEHSNEM